MVAMLVRTALVLGLAGLFLILPPALIMTDTVPFLPAAIRQPWQDRAGALCAGQCTCTYCDQLINGRCYTQGHLGPERCTTSCGTKRCQFRPDRDGCGPILYLGCDDGPCRGDPPPPPRIPLPIAAIPAGMGPTPTPVRTKTPPVVIPVVPSSACTRTWVELQPPVIGALFHDPPFPVLQSQEFDVGPDHGVNFHVAVQGGRAYLYAQRTVRACQTAGRYPHDCPDAWTTVCETYIAADYVDPVTQVNMTLTLRPESQHWIHSALQARYPRAHVRQAYHETGTWTGSTMVSTLTLPAWYPQDPGDYTGRATARTGGTPISAPQTTTRTHTVIVNLRDTTLAP